MQHMYIHVYMYQNKTLYIISLHNYYGQLIKIFKKIVEEKVLIISKVY
jgi:hypothetical protein